MTRRIQAMTISLAVVLALAVVWQGCGGNDHNGSGSVTIMGNVSSVTGAQAKAESPSRLFAGAEQWTAAEASTRAWLAANCSIGRLFGAHTGTVSLYGLAGRQ